MVRQALLCVETDEASLAGEGVGPELGVGAVNLFLVLRQLAEGGEGLAAHLHHLLSGPNCRSCTQLFGMGASVQTDSSSCVLNLTSNYSQNSPFNIAMTP